MDIESQPRMPPRLSDRFVGRATALITALTILVLASGLVAAAFLAINDRDDSGDPDPFEPLLFTVPQRIAFFDDKSGIERKPIVPGFGVPAPSVALDAAIVPVQATRTVI